MVARIGSFGSMPVRVQTHIGLDAPSDRTAIDEPVGLQINPERTYLCDPATGDRLIGSPPVERTAGQCRAFANEISLAKFKASGPLPEHCE